MQPDLVLRPDIGDLVQGIDRASGFGNNSYRDLSSLPVLADSCVEGPREP
jgi:hypothetical protein